MLRVVACSVALLLLISIFPVDAGAVNQIRVYVPAQYGHGAQQLIAGTPSDIYVEFTNDVTIQGVECPLIVQEIGTGSLWPAISESQSTFLVDTTMFVVNTHILSWQDGIWPDTTEALSVGGTLVPGTHQWLKMTVTPTGPGTVQFTTDSFAIGFSVHQPVFVDMNSNFIEPALVALPIIVLSGDCNGNGIDDLIDIVNGTSADCDDNGIPDECEQFQDCNSNGIPDACEIADGTVPDCNGNNVPDQCDIDDGTSADLDGNGIPDECDGWSANTVVVYVPPAQGHGPQQMVVGQPNDLYVTAIMDGPVDAIEVPLELKEAGGASLWPAVVDSQVTFLEGASSFLLTEFIGNWQDGVWPDTLEFVLVSGPLVTPVQRLFKITVTPSVVGTIQLDAPSFMIGSSQHALLFCPPGGSCFTPGFVAPDIDVIAAPTVCCIGVRGDVNGDGVDIDVVDLTAAVDFLFGTVPPIPCPTEADINGDGGLIGGLDVVDLTIAVDYLFGVTPTLVDCP
ncbi:MAG: hypothetical protein ACE5FH_08185 [Candidatus Zixiibacteriota bacterium]